MTLDSISHTPHARRAQADVIGQYTPENIGHSIYPAAIFYDGEAHDFLEHTLYRPRGASHAYFTLP